ncbi:MAG: YdcF family protein [Clostridiales bacterium]|nr:YdcF family protein [Clostridiales bacterium]
MKKVSVKPLLICYLIITVGVVISLMLFGDTYSMYVPRVDGASNDAVEGYVEPEGIVEVTETVIQERVAKVTFKAVKKGTAFGQVQYVRNKDNPQEYLTLSGTDLTVTRSGIILSGNYDFGGNQVTLIGLVLFFLATMVFFIRSFVIRTRQDFFSYRTVLDLGLAMYFAVLTVIFGVMVGVYYIRPELFSTSLIFDYAGNGMSLVVMFSIPLIAAFAAYMSISNLRLITREGFRPVNLLGVFIGIFMILGSLVCLYFLYKAPFLVDMSPKGIAIFITKIVLAALFVYFECILLATGICLNMAALFKPEYNKDFIIILGCGIKKDGTLYPLLRGRVDRAIRFYHEQEQKTGKKAVFVPSGGQGSDEVISEGEAMKRYLLEQGIPEEQILPETASTTTLENMRFSKKLIDAVKPDAKVAFSTTNYHVFRGGMFAREAGMKASGMGSKTKWYFWPNAEIREFIGLVVNQLWVHVIVALGLAVLSIALANMGTLLKFIL